MHKSSTWLILGTLVFCCGGTLWAEQVNFAAGETAAAYLNLPVNARQTGMAGAGVAVADDLGALTVNPAGLSRMQGAELQALHGFWVQDIFYDYLAFGQPVDAGTAVAASLAYFNFGSMDKYVMDAIGNPVAQGTFTPYVYLLTAGVGQSVLPELGVGLNLKYLSQNIDTSSSTAFAVDLGAAYATDIKGLNVGLTLSNIGSELDGKSLPLDVNLGAAYQLALQGLGQDQLNVTAEAAIPTMASDNYDVMLGAEYWYNRLLALRVGYQLDADAGLGGIEGLTAGLGFNYQMLSVQFGFTSLGVLGEVYQIGLGLKL
ncbi:MAG: PorV/PorQ family protein [candidate division FCPU426 bacterium]